MSENGIQDYNLLQLHVFIKGLDECTSVFIYTLWHAFNNAGCVAPYTAELRLGEEEATKPNLAVLQRSYANVGLPLQEPRNILGSLFISEPWAEHHP